MKPLAISDPASEELREAVRWYEERRAGWGARLLDAVSHTFDLLRAHPEIGEARRVEPPSRHLRVLGFPYYVAYRLRDHDIYIVAVAHTSRRPGYWKHRS